MNGRGTTHTILLLSLALVGFVISGCPPQYPNCKKDEHCQNSEKGQEEGKLYCVNGMCQQCRNDEDCGDPGMECNAGACEEIPNYCESDADCSGSQVCRDNRCGPECTSDDECDEGYVCEGGSCTPEAECSTDADCASGETCRDGECVEAQTSTRCTLKTVYFAYDSSSLSSSSRDKLESNADCINQKGQSVKIAGNCDERGSNEYNIALGERRAKSVREYLNSLGVSTSDMSTISYGEERLARQCGVDAADTCHEENRRVEFNWQ